MIREESRYFIDDLLDSALFLLVGVEYFEEFAVGFGMGREAIFDGDYVVDCVIELYWLLPLCTALVFGTIEQY